MKRQCKVQQQQEVFTSWTEERTKCHYWSQKLRPSCGSQGPGRNWSKVPEKLGTIAEGAVMLLLEPMKRLVAVRRSTQQKEKGREIPCLFPSNLLPVPSIGESTWKLERQGSVGYVMPCNSEQNSKRQGVNLRGNSNQPT